MEDLQVLAATFREHGMAHTPLLVSAERCDELVDAWHEQVVGFTGLLRRQHNLCHEPHERSADGFVVNPLFAVHRLQRFPRFAQAAQEIVDKTALRACAQAILGGPARWLQSAFFESSEGTAPHRDDPPYSVDGAMVGAWVALEEIVVEAGPLVLWPGSRDWHDPELDALGRSVRASLGEGRAEPQAAAAYHRRLGEHLAGKAPVVCTIGKGDVVWWDRRVVHGALTPTVGSGRSRRSLVLHFIPQ